MTMTGGMQGFTMGDAAYHRKEKKVTPDQLIDWAMDAGMFVTVEMKWQYERWENLAKRINEELL